MRPASEVQTLGQLCLRRAATHGEHPALADGTLTVTYAELGEQARAAAGELHRHGVRRGDRVALQGRNSVAWVVSAFGALLCGAAVVPVGHGASARERATMLAALRPALLVHAADVAVGDGLGDLPTLTMTSLTQARAEAIRDLEPDAGEPDAPALILSSSGTTGQAKSVPMTHAQLLRLYAEVGERLGVRASDRVLGAVPLAHSFGFNGLLLVTMLAGGLLRLLPSYDRGVVGAVVRDEELTVLAGPPTIYHDLEHTGMLPAPRLAIAGGQVVAPAELADVARAIGIPEIVIGYGMTETCGTVSLGRLRIDDPRASERPPRAVWMTPVTGVEVAVLDEEDASVRGTVGRVVVRGFNLALPYGVADALRSDGWFDTGDLGSLDDAGRLTIVGRRSDMVIISGFNVHPREVETVLSQHAGVAQVAVTGVPDRRRGQRLVALVVPRRGTVDVDDLDAHARARLSAYKVPVAYHVLEELPLTSTGKLARTRLREIAEHRAVAR